MQKLKASEHLLKRAMELGSSTSTAIKGQALADFITEFTYIVEGATKEVCENVEQQWWKLYVDGSLNDYGAGARLMLMLISPEGHKITCALRFDFNASNNKAKYNALLAGLRLAKELKARNPQIFSDSQLVVKQVTEEYQARGEKMAAYLRSSHTLLKSFNGYSIVQVPRVDNTHANALARLASTKEVDLLGLIPVEQHARPSIAEEEVNELGPDEFTTNELVPGDHGLHELTCDPDNELATCEQSQQDEVALTETPPQPNELILRKIVL